MSGDSGGVRVKDGTDARCGEDGAEPRRDPGGCGGGAVGGGGTELASELTSSEAGGDGVPREKSSVSDHARRRARCAAGDACVFAQLFLPSMLFDTDFMSFWRGDVGGVAGDGSKGGDSERALCASTLSATTTTSDSAKESAKLESVGVGECDRGDISMAKTSEASPKGRRGVGRLTLSEGYSSLTSSPSGVESIASLASKECFQRKRRGDSGRNHFPKPAGEFDRAFATGTRRPPKSTVMRTSSSECSYRDAPPANRLRHQLSGDDGRPSRRPAARRKRRRRVRRALDALLLPPQLPDALDQDVGTHEHEGAQHGADRGARGRDGLVVFVGRGARDQRGI